MLLPGDPMAGTAFVVPRVDTGYFVRALVKLPPGKKLLGYGSFLNHEEYVRLWTGILGVPNGGVKRITVEEATAYEGGPHGREVAETFASVLEVNYLDDSFLHPHQVWRSITIPSLQFLLICFASFQRRSNAQRPALRST